MFGVIDVRRTNGKEDADNCNITNRSYRTLRTKKIKAYFTDGMYCIVRTLSLSQLISSRYFTGFYTTPNYPQKRCKLAFLCVNIQHNVRIRFQYFNQQKIRQVFSVLKFCRVGSAD